MKLDFNKIKQFLKPTKKPTVLPAPAYTRAFRAAMPSRFLQWLMPSNHKVNADLIAQLKTLQERSIDLSKNNEIFRSFLGNCQRSIVGAEGFRLQLQVKNADGSLNKEINDQLEWLWYDFGHYGNLEVTQTKTDIDFDVQILRTILVDGEVFIRIIKDKSAKYGVKFKLIDPLAVDFLKNQPMAQGQNGIFNGVEVDHNYKPIRYYIRECIGFGNYESGKLEAVPADQIIHLFRPEFIDQVRGYSPIVASYDSLKHLDDFSIAELIAAKIGSCQGVFYQRNDKMPAGDFLDQQNMRDDGSFMTELSPGSCNIVPNGYSVKTMTPNHPNSQFGEFVKATGKRIGSAIGTNYNTLFGDMQNVSYSSLRSAHISQQAFVKDWQRYLIENWKNKQFEILLKNYIINTNSELKPSQYQIYLKSYRFIGKQDEYYDLAKEIIGTERALKLGLTSPIAEIEKRGYDWNEVLNDWQRWNAALKEKGLNFNIEPMPLDAVQKFNDESNNPDQDNK